MPHNGLTFTGRPGADLYSTYEDRSTGRSIAMLGCGPAVRRTKSVPGSAARSNVRSSFSIS